jgi:hypothetical protein
MGEIVEGAVFGED